MGSCPFASLEDTAATRSPGAPSEVGRACRTGGCGARVLHRHIRRRGGQRRVAIHPRRSRWRDLRSAVGRGRLHIDVRRPAARRGRVQRSARRSPGVHIGVVGFAPRRPHAGSRLVSAALDRRPFRAGLGRGGDDAGLDGADRPGLPGPVTPAERSRDLGDGRGDRVVVGLGGGRAADDSVVAADLPHQHPRRRRRRRARRPHTAIPAPRGPVRPLRFATAVVSMGALTFGAIEAGERGFTAPVVLTSFAVAALAFVAFVAEQRRAPHRPFRSSCSPVATYRSASSSGSRSSSATTGCRSS